MEFKMTIQNLKEITAELKKQYELKVLEVNRAYCDANNPYKVGDIFTDHIGSVLIESIKYYHSDTPECVYFGTELKKDGTPRKDGSKRSSYQSNELKSK